MDIIELEEKESSASVNGDENKMVGVLTLFGDEAMGFGNLSWKSVFQSLCQHQIRD